MVLEITRSREWDVQTTRKHNASGYFVAGAYSVTISFVLNCLRCTMFYQASVDHTNLLHDQFSVVDFKAIHLSEGFLGIIFALEFNKPERTNKIKQ